MLSEKDLGDVQILMVSLSYLYGMMGRDHHKDRALSNRKRSIRITIKRLVDELDEIFQHHESRENIPQDLRDRVKDIGNTALEFEKDKKLDEYGRV